MMFQSTGFWLARLIPESTLDAERAGIAGRFAEMDRQTCPIRKVSFADFPPFTSIRRCQRDILHQASVNAYHYA